MIGNMPADTRLVECAFCGTLMTAYSQYFDDQICSRCELYSLYSDLFKAEHGCRPHDDPSMSYMRDWIARYDERHPQVH